MATKLNKKRVVIVGASSQIAQVLLPLLTAKDILVHRVTFWKKTKGAEGIYEYDQARESFTPELLGPVEAIVTLAPLPTIGNVIKMAKMLCAKRVIAFGSTGTFTKAGSASTIEQDFVFQQVKAEQVLSDHCGALGIAWTLFRPTMVYGADIDLNVAFIKSIIQKYGFFPIPFGAEGLRQPVHVGDLATACVSALECEQTFGHAYNLGGGEILKFPSFVRRISYAAGKRPILIPVPLSVYYVLIFLAVKLLDVSFIRKEMVDRMFMDLVVDNQPAIRDFGYSCRSFSP